LLDRLLRKPRRRLELGIAKRVVLPAAIGGDTGRTGSRVQTPREALVELDLACRHDRQRLIEQRQACNGWPK